MGYKFKDNCDAETDETGWLTIQDMDGYQQAIESIATLCHKCIVALSTMYKVCDIN